jgi:hypothetical protein
VLNITGLYDKLEIVSITGQVLATVYNQSTVDVVQLIKGVYLVRIQSNEQSAIFKVIK